MSVRKPVVEDLELQQKKNVMMEMFMMEMDVPLIAERNRVINA
jgi:hypothetical protein